MLFKFKVRSLSQALFFNKNYGYDWSILWSWKLHFIYGPCMKNGSGIKYYFENKRHRENGPACIESNGKQEYYMHGELHNIKGPAVIYTNGDKEYWIDGKNYAEESWKERTNAF